MSGIDPTTPNIVLPAALGRLLPVLEAFTASDMPAIALIGGMVVNIRLSTTLEAHRATRDVDVVEAFDARGQMRAELTDAPRGLGQLVAPVVRTEILANPARALLR